MQEVQDPIVGLVAPAGSVLITPSARIIPSELELGAVQAEKY